MTEDTTEHWESYFDDEEAKGIIGKHLLVGVTHRNHQDEITGIEQFHGEIIRASREEGIIIRLLRCMSPTISKKLAASIKILSELLKPLRIAGLNRQSRLLRMKIQQPTEKALLFWLTRLV